MLTQKQLAVVREITLSFNDIEYFLDWYLAKFLDTPPKSAVVAHILIKDIPNVDRKIKVMKKIADAFAKKRPEMSSTTDWIQRALKEADAVRVLRNGLVHSTIVPNSQGKPTRLLNRDGLAEVSEEQLRALARRCAEACDNVNCACADLLGRIWGIV